MATHEQAFLGPAIEALAEEGLITISDDTNAYMIVWRLGELAAENGVHIHADNACYSCLIEDGAPAELIERARAVEQRLFGFDPASFQGEAE